MATANTQSESNPYLPDLRIRAKEREFARDKILEKELSVIQKKSSAELITLFGGDTESKNYLAFFDSLKLQIKRGKVPEDELRKLLQIGNKVKKKILLKKSDVELLERFGLSDFSEIETDADDDAYVIFARTGKIDINQVTMEKLSSIAHNPDAPAEMLSQIADSTKSSSILLGVLENISTPQETIDDVVYEKVKTYFNGEDGLSHIAHHYPFQEGLQKRISPNLFPDHITRCMETPMQAISDRITKENLKADLLKKIESNAISRIQKDGKDDNFNCILKALGENKFISKSTEIFETITLEKLIEKIGENQDGEIVYIKKPDGSGFDWTTKIYNLKLDGFSKNPSEKIYFHPKDKYMGSNKYGSYEIAGTMVLFGKNYYSLSSKE